MLPSETMIWQPEFTDKTLSRKPGAVQIPAESNGIVNVDLIAYYVSTVVPSEITPGEADAIVNVTLDYR
ncbi:hypothetical protein FCZ54_08830 [Escherichia coli]|nr:hypothetical protein [Escherichia coli]